MEKDSLVIKTAEDWGGSYEAIHQVLYRAHQKNREYGLIYKSAFLSEAEIKEIVGNGVTFVALLGEKVIGTASVSMRLGTYWFDKGLLVAHFCLDAVLPEYQGRGVMTALDKYRTQYANTHDARAIRSGTAMKNSIQRKKFKRDGFIPVRCLVSKGANYDSIMYIKWLDRVSPYSKNYCRYQTLKSYLKIWGSRILISIKDVIKDSLLYRWLFFDSYKYCRFIDDHHITKGRGKMKWSKILFDLPYKDFYQCRCDSMNFFKIRDIVPLIQQKKLWKRVNSSRTHDILCNKYKCYELFRESYKREVVLIKDGNIAVFADFVERHHSFIVKPLSLNCGKGIQIMNNTLKEDAYDIAVQLLKNSTEDFVAEELIVQDDALGIFHRQSVNTLRINTVNYGNDIEVIWPCLRIGRGENIVDNAGAGGIFGAIDVRTGCIIKASDEYHHSFETHPDTGKQIVGFQIPRWEEACEMAKRLATVIPDCHFVGWDLALTEKGWVMVEGNYGPLLLYQIALGQGIRKEFRKIERVLRVK